MTTQELNAEVEKYRNTNTLKEYLESLYQSDEAALFQLDEDTFTEKELEDYVRPLFSRHYSADNYLSLRMENYEKWNLIFNKLNIPDSDLKVDFCKRLGVYVYDQVLKHHENGDDAWLDKLKEKDEEAYMFCRLYSDLKSAKDKIEFCLKTRDEDFTKFRILYNYMLFSNVPDEKEAKEKYKEKESEHIDSQVKEHKEKGDFDSWLEHLLETDIEQYKYVAAVHQCGKIKAEYALKIAGHRNAGDLMDWLYDEVERLNLSWGNPRYSVRCGFVENYSGNDDFGFLINDILEEAERLEFRIFRKMLSWGLSFSNEELAQLRKLSRKKKDSADYKRYVRIRSKITDIEMIRALDNPIRFYIKEFMDYKAEECIAGFIACIIVLFIGVGAFHFVPRWWKSGKEYFAEVGQQQKIEQERIAREKEEAARQKKIDKEKAEAEKKAAKEQKKIAKKEALEKLALEQEQKKQEKIAKKEQRERANKEYLEKLELEKEQKKQQKDTQKVQQEDVETMAQLGQKKLSLQELFSETREPLLYVIAPMTYDTKQFVQDNSHDKALFGTKDNSAERLTVLESCITDFIRAVDDKTGVSFLDRSKISQIEKEHKFQLGDWSSASKTAEMGHALNANVLLFLDKFGFVDQGSGEYRFEAKFVDINTMQSSVYNISYQNAKKKITTPGVVQTISFRDFTAIPAESAPFSDELSLTVKNALRTVQRSDMAEICPLGAVQKFALSEYDTLQPKTELLKLSSIMFDGFGGAELKWGDKAESATYSFTQLVPRTERVVNSFYTDGRIGTLTLKTSAGEETLDVYTADNREFYLRAGTANLTSTTVNYYLHMTRN